MNECRACRDRMVEALYGELGPAEKGRFDAHVLSCPDCAAERSGLDAALRLMAKRRRPDPGPEFWEGYWDRLSRRLLWETVGERPAHSLWTRLTRPISRLPRWSYQAAGAAALLVVGILIGSRLVTPPPSRLPSGHETLTAAGAAPDAAVVRAENFVERSKLILLGLVNYNPAVEDAYALDLGRNRSMSSVLAAEAPAIREGLKGRSQKRLRDLVADLEVILMQIANLESEQDVDGVELVKQGVDKKGLFLKIDLERMAREAGASKKASSSPGETAVPKSKKI